MDRTGVTGSRSRLPLSYWKPMDRRVSDQGDSKIGDETIFEDSVRSQEMRGSMILEVL